MRMKMKRINILVEIILAVAMTFSVGLGGLVGCDGSNGGFYTLQEAYANGWLTKDDVMEVCYYRFGEVWLGENLDSDSWVRFEYDPKHTRQELDQSVENDIKKLIIPFIKVNFLIKMGISLEE